jgi:hypothetical protein
MCSGTAAFVPAPAAWAPALIAELIRPDGSGVVTLLPDVGTRTLSAKVRKPCARWTEVAQDSPDLDRGSGSTAEHTPCSERNAMSASVHLADLVQDGRTTDGRNGERALRLRQLSVVREMLGTLDTLTIAGQHYDIDKVIAFVDGQVRGAARRVSERNRATLMDLMTQLRDESVHRFPDSTRFAQRAENLISLLVAIG